MSGREQIEADLENLPSTAEELILLFEDDLPPRILDGVRAEELEPSAAFWSLWVECEDLGIDPNALFRKKGLIS